MKRYDVIIIGAGIAGMTAGIYVARAGKSALVLEKGARGGQIVSALKVENWPGDYGVSGVDLTDKIYHQMNKCGVDYSDEEVVEIRQSKEFASVDDASEEVRPLWLVKTDEAEYSCSAIIIAVGTEPRKLSESQTKDAGKRPISYCAICDGTLYSDRPVVVVGSGNTAKHEIRYLEGICSKVYHIHHDEPIPEEAEAVFVAIGRVPMTGFLDGVVSLDDEGYVVADEDCRTSCPGIYVAGDCRTKEVRQLVTAAGDGAVAGGGAVQYIG